MHSTISLIMFFQWYSKSTRVSLSSERSLQLLWEFSPDRGWLALSLHPLQAGKFQFRYNIRRPIGIRNHTPQARGVADKRHRDPSELLQYFTIRWLSELGVVNWEAYVVN